MITPGTKSLSGNWPYPDVLPYPNGYEPSSWVSGIVGRRYRGFMSDCVYKCIGYDPAIGFWMQSETDEREFTNVSERAIGRTFHAVR